MQKFSVGTNSLPQQFVCSWALWHLRFVVPGNEHVSKWMKQFNRISVRKDTLGTLCCRRIPHDLFSIGKQQWNFSFRSKLLCKLDFWSSFYSPRPWWLTLPKNLIKILWKDISCMFTYRVSACLTFWPENFSRSSTVKLSASLLAKFFS